MPKDRPLLEYLPDILRDVREYQAIAAGGQPEIDQLWNETGTALDNQFVETATEYGIGRWESILGIVPKATLTLEERRFTILTRLAEQLPYTIRMLANMLTSLCGPGGFVIILDPGNYTISIKLSLTQANNFNDADLMLRRVCPANLAINLILQFNQWQSFQTYRWADMAAMTWYDVRNEVLAA